jgi:hypothetical protein
MSASQPRLARSGQSRAVEALGFVVIFPRQFSAKPLVSAKPLAGKHTCSFRFDIQKSGADAAAELRRVAKSSAAVKPNWETVHE